MVSHFSKEGRSESTAAKMLTLYTADPSLTPSIAFMLYACQEWSLCRDPEIIPEHHQRSIVLQKKKNQGNWKIIIYILQVN